MMLRRWEELPERMQAPEVRPYYNALAKKRGSLLVKRLFDVVASALLLALLWPALFVIAVAVKLDSRGPVFYRQTRVTQYGREFRIFKFRTMVDRADTLGSQVTVGDDARITRVGRIIRRCRLDELPQLLNVLSGSMTFVGTRPEVPKFVAAYTTEMLATLLLPAGITSEASIRYRNEDALLKGVPDADAAYIDRILPEKMYYNLEAVKSFTPASDLRTLLRTVLAVLGRDAGTIDKGRT